MKQIEIIAQIKSILLANSNIETAILYGSFARKTPSVNSDIDIATVVSSDFEVDDLTAALEKYFSEPLLMILKVDLRNKIVLYFRDSPKAEIAFAHNISEHNRNYLGSEIAPENIADSILFDKTKNALQHLQDLTATKKRMGEKEISSLIDKFVYEFESSSNAHRRSDGYHFYYFYNIALNVAVQLNHLSKGETKFNFLPKNMIAGVLTKEEQNDFYNLKGTLFLPEANEQKRKLLDFFYAAIKNLVSIEKMNELQKFCEAIYKRDFIWNFRDISQHNPKIKSGIIFRTSTMTLFQNEDFFENFITDKKIKTVIDLRAEREVAKSGYTEKSVQLLNLVHAPFNPWNQSIEFQTTHHQGTNIEIAYRFFTLECKIYIKQAIEAILEEKNATAIHCHAGKDRTGIFISILHLLSGADMETVYEDYLATEMDTRKEYLDIALEIIEKQNGVEGLLLACELTENQIVQLKQKITNG